MTTRNIKKAIRAARIRVFQHIDSLVRGAKISTGKRVAKARRELEKKYGPLPKHGD